MPLRELFKKEIMKTIINDFKELTYKKFIEQRYHLHLSVGAVSSFIMFFVAFEAHSKIGQSLISLVVLFIAATAWEFYREWKYLYPLDWADVRWSVYGAIIGVIIGSLI